MRRAVIKMKKSDNKNQADYKKVVVITGASSGIGKATAIYFANKGCKVYGLSRRVVAGENFESISCDVTNSSAVEAVLADIFNREGHIDCFYNNAGMGISGAAEYIAEEENKKLFTLNLLAFVSCAKLTVPYLKKSKGILINTGSIAGVVPIPYQAAYSASKAAINSYSMAIRNELHGSGVRVCTVMPGDTKTGFTDARLKTETDGGYGDKIKKSVARMEHDERSGKNPESVAKVVYKLFCRKNPPALVSVGFSYKLVAFLAKILPNRLMLFIVGKLYG